MLCPPILVCGLGSRVELLIAILPKESMQLALVFMVGLLLVCPLLFGFEAHMCLGFGLLN